MVAQIPSNVQAIFNCQNIAHVNEAKLSNFEYTVRHAKATVHSLTVRIQLFILLRVSVPAYIALLFVYDVQTIISDHLGNAQRKILNTFFSTLFFSFFLSSSCFFFV